MKLEQEKVQLKNFQLSPTPEGGTLTLLENRKSYRLNSLHFSYLEVLRNSGSIEGLVQFFLGQGWLVSFRELHNLLQFLVTENILENPSFTSYLLDSQAEEVHFQNTTLGKGPAPSIKAQDLPFFRSLEASLASYLLQKAQRLTVHAQSRIIQAGHNDRDLYILLQGQAGIYRILDEKRRQRIATLGAGSLFGETGFLLNLPRTADVITTSPSEVLRVPHLPEFDELIKSEKAQSLQHRFWVLQALASSPFFKDLPNESLDSLIFTGKLCQASAHQVLFQEGQPGNTCYILIQGNVVVSQQGRNINVLPQGSCFGEISLLMSGGRRTATITTQQNSILLEIFQNDFYRVLAQNLILAKEIEALAAQRLENDAKRARP